ncbi:O-antigen ligase family protein [Bacillus mycoides]
MEKVLEKIWVGIFVSSFLGSYLGIPGNQSIFLFRILLILHAALFVLFGKKDWKRIANVQFFFILLSIWLAGNVISLFWAIERGEALRYIYYVFEASYMIFLVVYYVRNQKSYRLFTNVIVWFYLIALFIGLTEVLTGWHMPLSGSLFYETSKSQFQPTAFLFNTNDYGMFLVIFFPLVFWRLWGWDTRPWNVCLAVLVLLLSLYLVITTYSRLSIVAFILETLIIFLFYLRKSTVFFIFGMTVYLFIDSFLEQGLLAKIRKIIVSSFTQKGASTEDRMNLYETAWAIIRDSHFIGVGAGNVPIQIQNYLRGHETINNLYRAPHNFWLESIGGIGFFAFAIVTLIVVLFVLSIHMWWRNRNMTDTVQYLIPLIIVFVFCLSSVGLSTIIEKRYLWLALGIAVLMIDINFSGKEKENG